MGNMDSQIDLFKASLGWVWQNDSRSTWPIDMNDVTPLFLDIFVEELFQDIHDLKEAGLEDRAVAKRFSRASRIIRLVMPCVLGMKILGKPIPAIHKRVSYLLNLADLLGFRLPGAAEGKNTMWSQSCLDKALADGTLVPATVESSRAFHKLGAILWNYSESLCFRLHGFIREFHGPYPMELEGRELLVRDFFHLEIPELWSETRDLDYRDVRLVAVYRDLGIGIDLYNNISIKPGKSYVANLEGYYVEAHGKRLDVEEIQGLSATLSKIMVNVTARVEALDWRQLALKYAEIFWFSKKALVQGRDWHPPREVRARIENGELSSRFSGLAPETLQRLLRIAF